MIKEVIYLLYRRKIIKCDCSNYPTFKVSSCPREPQVEPDVPGTTVTPVYGSLYNGEPAMLAIQGTNVDFNIVGPLSGVTADVTNDSITVNSPGVYTISFSTNVFVSSVTPGDLRLVYFQLSINGNPDTTKQAGYQTVVSNFIEATTLSRTDQLLLNQGDVIQVSITTASAEAFYSHSALVVTKIA